MERTKAAELFMFTSIFQDQASRLRELALEFHKMGHSSAALLCLDQYFAQTFRIQDMVLVDAVEELNLFYIYANLLCTAAYRTDPCEDTGTATLFGFQRITENRFLVPRDTWLHTTALEVEHLQLGSRTSDSDSDFTLSASKLRNIFQHVLGLRLKQRIIAENDECARSKAFQPCLVFAVSGVCRQPICPEAHVSPSVVNTEYYNMRVRLHLQQILILQSFKENSHQEVEGKGTKFWLNRLYEALYPPYHAFGSISDLALSTIPEAVKALSIVKDWVRTLVYKREFSPATNFLTDVMRTTTLALTFDRSQAIYLRNAAYFRAPTPHMYIRRSGSSILPELLGVMSGSYTWSLSAGFAFVEHVVIQQLPINIGVLCDLVDFLCSSVILCRRQPGMAFLHDVTIPRSWLLRFIKYDLPYLNAEMQTETFHLLLTRMGDLLETLHDGGKGSEYLLYGIVRNLSNVPAVVRHVFVARILKAIGLLGYNVRSDLLRRKIRMLVLSMRHEGCTLPSLYSGYVDAARNSWDELAKAIRRSLQHDTMDEMIHLLHKSKVQATQRSASIGVRQVVYNNLADVQELLNPAHNQFESQSSLDEEADREEDSVDEMGNVTPIQNITAAEREIAASLIQRVYRKVLRHRQGVAKGGTTGLRAQVYASCTEEVSRLGDNPGIYLRLFLGPLPHILVCLEIVRVDTISHKMKAKGRLKTCSSDEYNTLDDLLTQANKANKAVVNLQKQLSPSSAFHKRRNIKQLRKLVEEANVLVSSLPFDTSSDLSDDLYLGIKGIVTERSSTSQICTE